MQGHPVWFEIHVEQLGRAEAFYTAIAGWQFDSLDGMPPESYRMISATADGVLGGALVAGIPERHGGSNTGQNIGNACAVDTAKRYEMASV